MPQSRELGIVQLASQREDAAAIVNLRHDIAGEPGNAGILQMKFGIQLGILNLVDLAQRLLQDRPRARRISQLRHGTRLVSLQTYAYQQRRILAERCQAAFGIFGGLGMLADRVAERRIRQIDIGTQFRGSLRGENLFGFTQQLRGAAEILHRNATAAFEDQATHLQLR